MGDRRLNLGTGRDRLRVERTALYNLLIAHNSINWQGLATAVFFIAWSVVWVGSFFFDHTLPFMFLPITIVITLIIGRWWGLHVAVAGLDVNFTQDAAADGDEGEDGDGA